MREVAGFSNMIGIPKSKATVISFKQRLSIKLESFSVCSSLGAIAVTPHGFALLRKAG
jgi:hypothetical protein